MKNKISAMTAFQLGLLLILIIILICSLATGRMENILPLTFFIAITVYLLFLERWLNGQGICNGWQYFDLNDGNDLSGLMHSPPWPIIKKKIELFNPAILHNMKISPPEKTVWLAPGVYELLSFADSLWWEDEEGNYALSPTELRELIDSGQARLLEGEE
ncbi:MAG: hypothetical protein WC668_05045 [Patescibacteria group bacterium]